MSMSELAGRARQRWHEPRRTCWRGLLAAAALLAVAAGPAQAALWGYVDGAGVAHFASRGIDGRYQLVFGDELRTALRVPGKSDGAASLLSWLEIAPELRVVKPLLREAARLHGVDVELIQAVIAVESGFNSQAVSPRGAVGLMQLLPDAADRYASAGERLRPAAERLLDPRVNVLTGARMLADLTRRFGQLDLALAAWNAGEGTVRRAGNALPPIDETRAHVHLVMELYWALLQRSQTRRATSVKML
jgi:soluble lytic murein transglycosylase-like protein